MYLLDTNVLLEILLDQKNKETSKEFLTLNTGNICLSDFSLHSIGVILLRQKKQELFHRFVSDVLPHVYLVTLPAEAYEEIVDISTKYALDFDDSYQTTLAIHLKLIIVTFDQDFSKVKKICKIISPSD